MKSWEARKEEREGGRGERWQVGIKSVNQRLQNLQKSSIRL